MVRRNITSPLALGLLLAVLTLATFSPLLHAGFIDLDDQIYVTDNARVKAGLTPDNVKWAFENLYFGFYYPVTWLSHMTDCQLFGLKAEDHHLVSILIHVANALLLFLFLMKATGAKWRSWLVAALFALHPLHVESVAWIAERKDVLSTLFLFLSLLAYLHYSRKPTISRYLLVFLLLTLGLMAKSMLVTAPIVFLLLDFWPLDRSTWSPWKRKVPADEEGTRVEDSLHNKDRPLPPKFSPGLLILEKAPLLLLSAVFAVLTFIAQNHQGAVVALSRLPLWTRFANAAVAYATYIQKMVIPLNLTILYTYPPGGWPYWKITLSVLMLVLITVLVIKLSKKHPFLPIGWLLYLVVVFPVCGLFQTGRQAYADHYTYFSLVGVFLMLVWGVAGWVEKNARCSSRVGWWSVALIVVLALLSWHQAGYWRNSATVFAHDLTVNGLSATILQSLGLGLINEGKSAEAVPYLKKATQLDPFNEGVWGDIGLAFYHTGKFSPAEACLRRAVKLSPSDGKAYSNLGMVLEREGKLLEALASYRKAVLFLPAAVEPRVGLGRTMVRLGRYKDALKQFENTASLAPGDPILRLYSALTLAKLGKTGEARRELEIALRLAHLRKDSELCKAIDKRLKTLRSTKHSDKSYPELFGKGRP